MFVPAGLAFAAEDPLLSLLWIGSVTVATQLNVSILPRLRLDASLGAPVSIAIAVLFPPPFAVLANVVAVHPREIRGQAPATMVVFNHAQLGLSAGGASMAASLVPIALTTGVGVLLRTAAAVLAYNLINSLAVSLVLPLLRRTSIVEAARESTSPIPRFSVDFGLSLLLAVLIVVAYQATGPLAIGLLALPLWLGYSALQSARLAEDRAEALAGQVRDLGTLNTTLQELLSSRSDVQVTMITRQALRSALHVDRVELSLDGRLPDDLEGIPVPGAGPAVIGLPADAEDPSGAVIEAVAGVVGMTLTRQRLERELAEVQRARAALSARILEEGNVERSQMATELHDHVLPALAAAQIQADNVRTAIERGSVDRASQISSAVADSVQDGISKLRDVLEDVQRATVTPGELPLGLEAALSELRLHHGVDGQLSVGEGVKDIPFALEILMLQFARGALANVGLHAQAARVWIQLDTTDKAMWLEVRDDGKGFDPALVPEGHHGLTLMAQRVRLARGEFEVVSAAGQGTRLRMEVPL